MTAYYSDQTAKEHIVIFDTTLRDGDQSPGWAMTREEKIIMARALAALNVDVIEAGFPISSRLDYCAVRDIANQIQGPRVAALARTVRGDIRQAAKALVNAKTPRIHTFIATSEEHMEKKLRMTRAEVLDATESYVTLAHEYVTGKRRVSVDGRRVFLRGRKNGDVEWSAEDASCSDIGFLIEAVGAAIDAGATTINLPDTRGYAQPAECEALFKTVIDEIDPGPGIVFSAHVHDDLGNAVANSMASIRGGARQVECTIRGIGERAGNAQTEAIVGNLAARPDLYPFVCNINRSLVKPTADLLRAMIPEAPDPLPITGTNACAHGSGIHQHGMMNGGCYEVLNFKAFGHGGTTFPLTRHSGEAGVMAVLESRGVVLPPRLRRGFMKAFKDTAGQLLESDEQRVISAETAARWAVAWADSRKPRRACEPAIAKPVGGGLSLTA